MLENSWFVDEGVERFKRFFVVDDVGGGHHAFYKLDDGVGDELCSELTVDDVELTNVAGTDGVHHRGSDTNPGAVFAVCFAHNPLHLRAWMMCHQAL